MNYSLNSNIETNAIGVDLLTKFYHDAKKLPNWTTASFDISNVGNFDANLSAAFLALNYKLYHSHKVPSRFTIGQGHSIFYRNGLISHMSGHGNNNNYLDDRESTIPLRTYKTEDDEHFSAYIKSEFLKHRGLDGLSLAKKNIVKDHYLEIFTNVDLHAKTTAPIFVCGQFYPANNALKFTLADLGQGFLPAISAKQSSITDEKTAIIWATTDKNSTKDPLHGPGGTGLKDLKQYCYDNNGSLQICCGTGFVTFTAGRAIESTLRFAFPGTLINIIFRNIC